MILTYNRKAPGEKLRLDMFVQAELPDYSRSRVKKLLEDGKGIGEAFGEAKLLPATYARTISLSVKSGSLDNALKEISERISADTDDHIEMVVGHIEPAIIILSSLMVGVIIMAVMLPLLNIMAAL